jgi:uncharacterized phage protein gp47/JayE
MATQQELALNMVQQLRLLDPSVSAEVGTPERKIIDTFAQELANAQIDLAQLDGGFDLDSKFGKDLDNFLSIFGFARQRGSQATGYVTFSRSVASTYVIPIPSGTQLTATTTGGSGVEIALNFATTSFGEIPAGETSVTIPVRSLTVGSIGNVAASKITGFARNPIIGVTTVTNDVPTTGGTDVETDAALKIRFKNTVFRNLAGTQDQYLALAVSTAFTTKANVVGPISRYQEYIQVPDVDDATADPDSGVSGNGAAGEYTSALSSIPYSKHVYSDLPYYVTNGEVTGTTIFYRGEVDFILNTTDVARDKGDAYRGRVDETGLNVNTDSSTDFQPNVTFFNVFTLSDEEVVALRPGDIVLFEHAYMSDASRNDYERQLLNCVDVFINGHNETQADAITVKPSSTFASTNQFVTNSASRFYFENFRRVGNPERRPVVGNFFQPLFWTPVVELPEKIVTATGTYLLGVHYWPVEDVSDIGRSVRARTGIEWNSTVLSETAESENEQYAGPTIIANTAESLEVAGYFYDKNIVDLQASLEANKQITTDVLAHQARIRYFKLDLTVMYTQGANISNVNSQIEIAVQNLFEGAYFGTTIQLSDLLQSIHNINGVDNVRWSRDITEKEGSYPSDTDTSGNPRFRIVECDEDGDPLCNFLVDRRTYGSTGTTEVQVGYYTGYPKAGKFKLKWTEGGSTKETGYITYGATAAEIKTAINAVKEKLIATVTGSGTVADPFVFTYEGKGFHSLFESSQNFLRGQTTVGATTVYDSDFFLKDDELPSLPSGALSSDTLPGLIIRKRAQNTWQQL